MDDEEQYPAHYPVRDMELGVARRLGVVGGGAGPAVRAGSPEDIGFENGSLTSLVPQQNPPNLTVAKQRAAEQLQKDAEIIRDVTTDIHGRRMRSLRDYPTSLGFQPIDAPTLPPNPAVGQVSSKPQAVPPSRRTPVNSPKAANPAETKDEGAQISIEEVPFVMERLAVQRNDAMTLNAVLQGRVDYLTQALGRANARIGELESAIENSGGGDGGSYGASAPLPDAHDDHEEIPNNGFQGVPPSA